MTHGDIKPQNVLVFKDPSGTIFAKLADFGYSGWDVDGSQKVLIKPPRSRPWDPPEYHHRGFPVMQAKMLDIYSFGMLCMWILFGDDLCTSMFIDRNNKHASTTGLHLSVVFSDLSLTDNLKHEGKILTLAHGLVEKGKISDVQKESLSRFFDSTLAREPERRVLDLEKLASLLSQDW